MTSIKRFTTALLTTLALAAASATAPAQTVTYIHTDPAGTPVMATDTNGNVVWKENYKPYGEEQANPPPVPGSHLGFTGKPYDETTGLGYFGGRYYDPVLGRFMGVDPAPPDPDNLLHSLNLYAYANNNPYRYVDPDGRNALAILAAPPLLIAGGWWLTRSSQQREQMIRDVSRAVSWVKGLVFNEAQAANAPNGGTKPPGADSEERGDGQKNVTKRPSRVRKGTEQGNWDNAEDGESGGKVCPTCGKDVISKPGEKNKDWDNDHNPPWRDRDLSGKDRKGVLDEYNRDTRLRCVGCNRSDNAN